MRESGGEGVTEVFALDEEDLMMMEADLSAVNDAGCRRQRRLEPFMTTLLCDPDHEHQDTQSLTPVNCSGFSLLTETLRDCLFRCYLTLTTRVAG